MMYFHCYCPLKQIIIQSRCILPYALIFMFLFMVQNKLIAQPETGALTGTVIDVTGGAVAGAKVVLRTTGQPNVTTTTDSEGRFRLQGNSTSPHELLISYPGFTSRKIQVILKVESETALEVRLEPEQVLQSLTVTEEIEGLVNAEMKTEIPPLETPQAVSVIGRQLLNDQNVRKLDDVLKNVAGVTVGGYYADWDYYRIRGFDASFTTYIDGLRGTSGLNEETLGLELVEVIKGPSASLYGQGTLGGMVNLVSKRPRPIWFADPQFSIGSYGFYEPALDIGGPLNKSKSVYFRLSAVYRDQGSFVDYVHKQRLYLAPAFTVEIGSNTTLTFLGRHVQDWNKLAFPLPAKGTVLPNTNGGLSISRFVGEPDNPNKVDERGTQIGYQLTHRFNEVFSLHQNLRASWYKSDWDHILYPALLDADERALWRYPFNFNGKQGGFKVDTNVEMKFATGSITHNLVSGVDYYREPNKSVYGEIDYNDFPGSYMPLDLFNPVYGTPLPSFPSSTPYSTNTQTVGLYLQEHARFFDRLTLTVGGRVDFASSFDDYGGDVTKTKDTAFTPRIGLTYEFIPGTALYTSFSKSFLPQPGYLTAAGDAVKPETGQSWEAGLKSGFLNGKFTTTLAVYQLTRQNVATDDPGHPGFYLVTGEQRSRGVELEGRFIPMSGLSLIVAYAFIDAKVSRDNYIPVGNLLLGVPKNTFNGWLRYTLQKGALKGFGVGLGGRTYARQAGDLPNTFDLPAYGVMDSGLFYERSRFRFQVNLFNTLDTRYFIGSYSDLYVLPGEPRTVRATIGLAF